MLLFRFTPSKISSAGQALLKTEWKEKSERRRGVEQNRQKHWKRNEEASGSSAMDALFFRRQDFKCLSLWLRGSLHWCADAHVCLYIEVHLGVSEYVIMSNDYYYLKSSDDFKTLRGLKVFGKSRILCYIFHLMKWCSSKKSFHIFHKNSTWVKRWKWTK